MNSLAHLSGDAIGRITDYLDGESVFSLYLCGSIALSQKLAQETRNLTFRLANFSRMPIWAFKLPHVRDIRIGLRESVAQYGELRSWSLSQIPGEVAKLENLDLSFPSTSFLTDATKDPMLLKRLFPSLKSLSMSRCQPDPRLLVSLGHLPSSLTSFALGICLGAQRNAEFPLSVIAKLPRTLIRLEITRYMVVVPEGYDEEKAKETWPPNLTHLTMYEFTSIEILNHLPADMKHLDVSFTNTGRNWEWKVSTIPKALEKLSVVGSGYSFVFDAPLPSTLRELDVSPDTNLRESDLPATLERLPLSFSRRIHSIRDLLPIFARLPHIKQIMLPPDTASALAEDGKPIVLSEHLTLLHTQCETRLSLLELPQSIINMSLIGLHPEDVHHLPSGLLELHIYQAESEEEFADPNSPWPRLTRDSISFFPLYLRSLWLDVRSLSDISGLKAIKRLFLLKELRLHGLWFHQLQTCPPLFERDSLPHSISFLSLVEARPLVGVIDLNEGVVPPSPDWLRLSDLSTLLPNLSSISIDVPIRLGPNELLGPTLATLPKSLSILQLEIVSVFEESALSYLPRDIIQLSLYLTQTRPSPSEENEAGVKVVKSFSNRHFANLPENLAYLLVYLPRQRSNSPDYQRQLFCKVNEGVISLLPQRLSSIHFNSYLPAESTKMSQAISQYRNNLLRKFENRP